MEEITTNTLTYINQYISFGYLVVFIFLSYGLRDFVGQFVGLFSVQRNVKKYSVFAIATILAPVWYYFFGEDPLKLFVTFAVGTSLYELIIKAIVNKLKS
jgi:hypothetical protein